MRILADENIPLLTEAFGHAGTLTTLPGRDICQAVCRDIDLLLVRSVTPVNAALLADTAVRFVGSTTTGHDHLDTDWLESADIAWANAPGCNATAVVEYVICVIAALQKMDFPGKKNRRAAIIGVGRIGKQVAHCLQSLGFETLLCDPFQKDIATVDLNAIADVDLISLHTPLTHSGPHPTFHLIDRHFLERQRPGCILLNTSRGAVICTEDLDRYGRELVWCLDVFEQEPFPDYVIVENALLATPHIAGYSLQARWRGTQMVYQAAIQAGILPPRTGGFPPFPHTTLSLEGEKTDWRDVVLSVFDPRHVSEEMKSSLRHFPNSFDRLRKHFPERHEFQFVTLQNGDIALRDQEILGKCGLSNTLATRPT